MNLPCLVLPWLLGKGYIILNNKETLTYSSKLKISIISNCKELFLREKCFVENEVGKLKLSDKDLAVSAGEC